MTKYEGTYSPFSGSKEGECIKNSILGNNIHNAEMIVNIFGETYYSG